MLIVSSGAIALARRALGLTRAAAAAGREAGRRRRGADPPGAGAWQAALAAQGSDRPQQPLLTLEDSEDRRRHLNARATLSTLLELGCVPVINENDTVATAEIRFGDNDRLAARVAEMVGADALVLLSDIDGLYTADPRKDPAARHLPVVERVSEEIMAMGGDPPPGYSSGGMRTKLLAARIATGAGCAMAIALGKRDHPLRALRRRGALHLVPARPGGAQRAQALDRRLALPHGQPGQWTRGQRGRWPAAPRCCRRGVPGRCRACSPAATRSASAIPPAEKSPAACPPTTAPTPPASPATAARRSRRSLGWRGRDEMVHRDDLVLL